MEKKTPVYSSEELFHKLYNIHTENDLRKFKEINALFFAEENWFPVLNSNYKFNDSPDNSKKIIQSIVKELSLATKSRLQNEFSKINQTDRSEPVSILDMRNIAYPEYYTWVNYKHQKRQARQIQVLADGDRLTPSLTIYMEGIGHSAEALDLMLCSSDHGDEDNSHFKIPPPIAFCGTEGYELIGSKNDENGDFVFTLVRKFQSESGISIKYLKENGKIFSFKPDKLELGLYESTFNVGTVKKFYSFHLPKLSRSVISRDLRQSINEYYIRPLLPILMVDRAYRYPKDIFLQRELYGLGYELEHGRSDLLLNKLYKKISHRKIGTFKINCFVFGEHIGDLSYNQVRRKLQQYFFRNKMAIVFTIEGRVIYGLPSDYVADILHLVRLKDFIYMEIICDEMKEGTKNLVFNNYYNNNESLTELMAIVRSEFCELGSNLYEEDKRRKTEKLTNS